MTTYRLSNDMTKLVLVHTGPCSSSCFRQALQREREQTVLKTDRETTGLLSEAQIAAIRRGFLFFTELQPRTAENILAAVHMLCFCFLGIPWALACFFAMFFSIFVIITMALAAANSIFHFIE